MENTREAHSTAIIAAASRRAAAGFESASAENETERQSRRGSHAYRFPRPLAYIIVASLNRLLCLALHLFRSVENSLPDRADGGFNFCAHEREFRIGGVLHS